MVIAEKLHAIGLLGMANSRLKDYLDLYVLLSISSWIIKYRLKPYKLHLLAEA